MRLTEKLRALFGKAPRPATTADLVIDGSGKIRGGIPDGVSPVICAWVVRLQDAMPGEIRNGTAWKNALAGILDTGRDPAYEKMRLDLILDWMWGIVLPEAQPIADRYGFGAEWTNMLVERSRRAAARAAGAAKVSLWEAEALAAKATAEERALEARARAMAVETRARAVESLALAVDGAALAGAEELMWIGATAATPGAAALWETGSAALAALAAMALAQQPSNGLDAAAFRAAETAVWTAAALLRPAVRGMPVAAAAVIWGRFDPPGLLARLISAVPLDFSGFRARTITAVKRGPVGTGAFLGKGRP